MVLTSVMDMVHHSGTHRLLDMVHHGIHRCDGYGSSVVLTAVMEVVHQWIWIWFSTVVCVVSHNSPVGSLLYLYVSHSTRTLLAPGLNGSLYTATGYRYVSEFVPSA